MSVGRTCAAIDAGSAGPIVADAARTIAAALGTTVDGIHVREDTSPDAETLSGRVGVPIRTVSGDPVTALLAEAAADDVVLTVVGTGDPQGGMGIGHVARALAEGSVGPLLVVPPRARPAHRGPLRALVPLDGDPTTTAQVGSAIELLTRAGIEIVVLHVFDAAHTPTSIDHTGHGLEAWGQEFLTRHQQRGCLLELRRGSPWRQVVTCAEDVDADLVVLAWAQQLTPGHAEVVRQSLVRSSVPILLVPATVVTDRARAVSAPTR